MSSMTPREIVHELDRHIIGQQDAKRAVAVALRNRWRRMQLDPRRRARGHAEEHPDDRPDRCGQDRDRAPPGALANAPFLKVEATKFTEVGYVGRDVESIVRDLVDVSLKMHREDEIAKVRERALDAAEERILDALLPPARPAPGAAPERDSAARQVFRKKLREGELDEREIDIELAATPVGVEIMAPPGMEEMTSQLQGMFANLSAGRSKTRRHQRARRTEDGRGRGGREAGQRGRSQAQRAGGGGAERHRLHRRDRQGRAALRVPGADVSREGVQRDLLPLIEGCTVSTKHGMVQAPTTSCSSPRAPSTSPGPRT